MKDWSKHLEKKPILGSRAVVQTNAEKIRKYLETGYTVKDIHNALLAADAKPGAYSSFAAQVRKQLKEEPRSQNASRSKKPNKEVESFAYNPSKSIKSLK